MRGNLRLGSDRAGDRPSHRAERAAEAVRRGTQDVGVYLRVPAVRIRGTAGGDFPLLTRQLTPQARREAWRRPDGARARTVIQLQLHILPSACRTFHAH